MSTVELATAYITLVPQMKGIEGEIKQQFSGGAAAAQTEGTRAGTQFASGFGGGLKTLAKGVAALGLAAVVVDYVKDSIAGLARIETINAQTESAIRSTGGAAGVTAGHVEELALSLEGLTAMEAESIQEGANLLLTFTNIQNTAGDGNDIFDQATETLVDYSTAMRVDASTGAIMLGKALNDPVKGITALSKAGVTFTQDQKDMIKAMVEAGDVAGAQKIILAELNKEFGGSGAAYADTAAGKWALFQDALGDVGQTIMSNLMPAFTGLLDVGTTIIGWVMNIPGPVYAAVGAFAAMLVVGQVVGFMKGLLYVIPLIVGGMGGLAGVAGMASAAMNALGGPWVVGLGLVAGALAFFTTRTTDAEAATAAAGERWERLVATLDAVSGAVTDATRAQIAQEAQDSGMLSTIQALGVSTSAYVDASAGVPGAADALAASVKNAATQVMAQSSAFQAVSTDMAAAGISQADWAAALADGDPSELQGKIDAYAESVARESGNASDATAIQGLFTAAIAETGGPLGTLGGVMNQAGADAGGFSDAVDAADQRALALGGTAEAAVGPLDAYAAAIASAGTSSEDTQPAIDSLKTATDDLASASAFADAAVQFLTLSLDAQSGKAITSEQATRAYDASIRGIGQAARDTADAVADVDTKTVALSAAIDEFGAGSAEATAAQRDLDGAVAEVADSTDKQFQANIQAQQSALALATAAYVTAGADGDLAAAGAAATASVEASRAAFIAAQPEADRLSGKADTAATALFGIPGAVATSITQAGADGVIGTADDVKVAVGAIPDSHTTTLDATTNIESVAAQIRREIAAIPDSNIKRVTIEQNTIVYTTPSGAKFEDAGGAMPDWGPFREDTIPLLAHRGEHMLDSGDVAAMGGQSAVYAFRDALHGAGADTGGGMGPALSWKAAKGNGTAMVFNVYQQPGQTAADLAREMNRVIAFQGSI